MIFIETKLKGAFIIDAHRIGDERGSFARSYCHRELAEHGMVPDVVQANMSTNNVKGTLRGLHFQRAPHQETKLVRCVRGALYDVIVDLRPGSQTFGDWIGVELSENNQRALFVPRDFAHGFVTLTDNTTAFYMVSQYYSAQSEGGIRWNDPRFNIEWPIQPSVVSQKDACWPDFDVPMA